MPEDPAVTAVERLFGVARRFVAEPGHRVEAIMALWLCACFLDDDATPTWLVFDRADDGRIAWCRVPNGIEPLGLVRAKDTAGDHTGPTHVIRWLQRTEENPWGSSCGGGDAIVLDALREKILAGSTPNTKGLTSEEGSQGT